MSAAGSESADASQNTSGGVYTIDPVRSSLSFRTRAALGLIGVRGTFDIDSGKVRVADPVAESTVEALVSASGFATDYSPRDDSVRSSDYLDVETYPYLSFVSERFEWSGKRGTLVGNLTVKDVTQPLTLDVKKVSIDEHSLTARATTTVDRYAFGITKAPGMAARNLRITLSIVASR